ncbi:hypothetical protein GCM10007160_19720 [Litchfieldella qijiaojingensis]|uniref:FAD dependent oxidoreductase domain-containing protein n=1 Tax=Litchfieldella qijiaojingensis TaxID=980347 RepID=A0ABQ2YSK8_9GAMM|nr:FAD-binding oxidoreductase [Halomonas qijiaojingensis]GGX92192.1 hypothetical protein GCM10007160_19720 [Halomonas qijiaojingensis]
MAWPNLPSHERPCGWNLWLPDREPFPTLRGDATADLVIVGAGYTGLAAAMAWQDARPHDRIKILDAERLGEGSPGRNSGFMLEIALANDASPKELERMSRLNALTRQTMARLRQRVEAHGIDCQLQHSGTYRAASSPAGRQFLASYRAFLDSAKLRYDTLDGDALAERIGTRYYTEGLYSPDCYLVQPAALIRGLAETLPANVELHEQCPATAIHRDNESWRVITAEGEIRTPRVILANNAFARAFGADASRLTAIYTYAAVTAVLADSNRTRIMPQTWGLLPAHRLGCTLRTTSDGRLMIRSRYSYEREASNTRIEDSLKASLEARFPELAPIRFERVWGGTTGLTHNGAPLWGEIQPGLYVSAGCNGGGIVKGTFLGNALARHALGLPVEDIQALFGRASWMPPEPVRRIGFHLTAALERRKASRET